MAVVTDRSNRLINHVEFDIDSSSSILHYDLTYAVKEAVERQAKYLADISNKYDQETRLTMYTFADSIQVVEYEIDIIRAVQRGEVLKGYKPGGNTALIDVALQGLDDLAKTATIYGNHAFLKYVFTDGEENRSKRSKYELKERLQSLPDNWTVGILVPNQRAADNARSFGFPENNIQEWDVTAAGVAKVSARVEQATAQWFEGRSRGVVGTRSLFTIDTKAVDNAVMAGKLIPLDTTWFKMFTVKRKTSAAEFSAFYMNEYVRGRVFYQLTARKPEGEDVQPEKKILLRHNTTGVVFGPEGTRHVLGLPENGTTVRIKPNMNRDYTVFVQSTAPNRALWPEDDVIITTINL